MARVLLLVAYYLLSNLIRAELIPAVIRQMSAKPTIDRKDYPTSKDSPVYYMYACINKEWVTMANSHARFPDPCRIFRHVARVGVRAMMYEVKLTVSLSMNTMFAKPGSQVTGFASSACWRQCLEIGML